MLPTGAFRRLDLGRLKQDLRLYPVEKGLDNAAGGSAYSDRRTGQELPRVCANDLTALSQQIYSGGVGGGLDFYRGRKVPFLRVLSCVP